MSTKHTLIPSRGVVHVFKVGDRIILKRAKNIVGLIEIKSGPRGVSLEYSDEVGNMINRVICNSKITQNVLRQHCWSFMYGTAMYLEEKLCPNGAKAIPEREDPKFPSQKFIIWCPTSDLPPRVILDGEDVAINVAKDMSKRHHATFYWARLEGFVESKKVTTYTEVMKTL